METYEWVEWKLNPWVVKSENLLIFVALRYVDRYASHKTYLKYALKKTHLNMGRELGYTPQKLDVTEDFTP